ncbi:MAG: hypothetical protein IVW54_05285 [Candidatus Binataceae bacterium]|nr:hypothetical protein [Candidatus Binataceae bacterium]
MRMHFPAEVTKKLGYYVYRLIDPRNGETFYVGKGKGDRVFQHARGALKLNGGQEDKLDAKMPRIKEIAKAGLAVGHVIHRHGIENERTAYEIEAAVIDAYAGLTNKARGHGNDFGAAHVEEIITLYGAVPFVARHPLLLISIRNSYEQEDKSIYEAVRYAWRIDPRRALRHTYVLAHVNGLVVGVFKPERWIKATKRNFPALTGALPKRWGFEGEEAEDLVSRCYLRKRVPDQFRQRGAANPVRFICKTQCCQGVMDHRR